MLQNRLAQLREERADNDKGFTLIELLVVVVIIGILIAIAIPLYLNYENGAKSKGAESDTRSAVSAVEQCFADKNAYPATATAVAPDDLTFTDCDQVVHLSSGDTITYTNTGSGTYTISTVNSDSGDTWDYDSTTGKVVKG